MRLTIARKIALAVVAVAILSIGAMAWFTTANLNRGFVAYLNGAQRKDLDKVAELIAQRYAREGNWDWLRHRPAGMREVLARMNPANPLVLPENPRPQPRRDGPPPRAGEPPPVRGYGPQRPPPPPREAAPPPEDEGRAGEPPRPRDPFGFAPRLSVFDADGEPVMGPPHVVDAIEQPILLNGRLIGLLKLRPLRQAAEGNDGAAASAFLRDQINEMLLMAAALIAFAALLATALARHLLRPIPALRNVTARLAQGDFAARAPLLSRDELAELAVHVNEMAQALEASEQQRRQMIADVAHELRTPLTVIRGELEALIDGIRSADQKALESLHGEVLRLNQLVDDLHQLALADAGELHYDWQQLDLAALVRPLLERYRPRAAKAGLDLGWDLPTQPVPVRGDHGRLTQVLINLLENSVRYTDAGGYIVVSMAMADDGHADLWVEDSAPGVPAGTHAHLFERLVRADSARTRTTGGSGLGLAIVKVLVEAHGGSISAGPSPLGGLKIHLRLPLSGEYA
ncbi:ATP-binding protein [Massilia sp. TS11]|uniref:ATP-binding protein n=1 Tax=Massilia sp. TS11 TaxID=2908003 RepID=UPI001EDB2733|nr:ATP-binding protein [Massilia sp. TS11]MCG2585705.1 ATP-binding protein [Massilia sp. TS11]